MKLWSVIVEVGVFIHHINVRARSAEDAEIQAFYELLKMGINPLRSPVMSIKEVEDDE
jgi:hypothetical protein